jgi:glycosyltransferase involved in cell wall biosynthesis
MVGDAVESVLSQDFSDFELIVVDDGSTDGTVKELSRWGSRVRVLSTPRRGVSAARNTGVGCSEGRYLAFLDSDDLWRSAKLARQTAFMEEHGDVEICQTEEIWLRNGRRVNPRAIHTKASGDIFLRSLDLCLVSPSAVMMRRGLFQRLGGFDETFPVCEDYDLWLRIAAELPIPLISEALVIKRGGHDDQLSRSMWGMDRYRVLALRKILRAGLVGARRAAVLEVLRRKIGILASGSRKRGKVREAVEFEAMLAEFEPEKKDGGKRDSRICAEQGISSADT